jgi:glycosyltransferase involved in cell wall biosynthesis
MAFSVVIAAYNAVGTLGATIESVLAQTRQDFEVIVVDDGSTDGTGAIAAAFAADDQRVQGHRQDNAGPSAARNRGIALAVGEYVSMLDSDDLWLPNYLAEMGRALEENPHAGLAYADAWNLDETSGRFFQATTAMKRKHPPGPTLAHEQLIAELLESNFVSGAVTVRRTVLEQVGGFDPDMSHGEDYELWLRIAISGFGVVRVAGQLAICLDRPGSLSDDDAAMVAGLHTVYQTVLERHPLSSEIRALVEARLTDVERSADRRDRSAVRILLKIRRALGAATRGARSHWRLRSTPPPDVAEAFPGLGLGRPASRASASPKSDL